MARVVIVGFALCVIVVVVVVVLWWAHDNHLRTHDEDLAVIKAALNLGGEPLVLVDEPTQPQPVVGDDTEPMRRVDVAGGARVRPSPRPRTDVDLSAFTFDPEAVSHRRRS